MWYISAQETATKWGVTKRRVQVLCASGRIEGAVRIGNMWVLPENAEKPVDARHGQAQTKPSPKQENPIRIVRNRVRAIMQGMIQQFSDGNIIAHDAKLAAITILASELLAHCIEHGPAKAQECDISKAVAAIAQITRYCVTPEILELQQPHRLQFQILLTNYPFCCDDILSWCYQYINKFGEKSIFWNTQFFTEKYMITTLIDRIDIQNATKILDPACGGGNFLLYCLDVLADLEKSSGPEFRQKLEGFQQRLFGYEIDSELSMVASINLRLKHLSILSARGCSVSLDDFLRISPNIFYPEHEMTVGALDICPDEQHLRRAGVQKKRYMLSTVLNGADVVITNPPFQTVKGMPEPLKTYLKLHYPMAKCDMCNAFIERLLSIAAPHGTVGIVSQNSWMYLDSFAALRKYLLDSHTLLHVWELGSNAFYDLSGEKANAVLSLWRKGSPEKKHQFELISLKELNQAKMEVYLSGQQENGRISRLFQQDLAAAGSAFNLAGTKHLGTLLERGPCYGRFGTPMQGTSTGNAKELIDFYWRHSGDPDWVPVSKGGGYARWQGLNHYCVKWGTDGSYIKNTKGSAIRNAAYFSDTKLVFSDTGTAGLNARTLLDGQIFVASGPGIRNLIGDELAHLAFLNSRLASYYIRLLSPKLTVAAGYIAKLPVSDAILSSNQLRDYAGACLAAKRHRLQKRPNNLEFSLVRHSGGRLEDIAHQWYQEDLQDEWTQLSHEHEIEQEVGAILQLTDEDLKTIDSLIGPKLVLTGKSRPLPSVQELEQLMCKHLDTNCTLRRTKAKRNALGCDGILEYLSQESGVSCEEIWQYFSRIDFYPNWLKEKYLGLYLHALVLSAMEYPTGNVECLTTKEIAQRTGIIENTEAAVLETWLEHSFDLVHPAALMGDPVFHYAQGAVERLKGDME